MDFKEFSKRAEDLVVSLKFQELESSLSLHQPNLWHILDVSRKEIRMSKFLAWLLNPKERHSFGDMFLKGLVIKAIRTETGQLNDLTPIKILVTDLHEVQVSTEHQLGRRRCDIAIFSAPSENSDGDKVEGFLCLIENKIDAKESSDQTKDYYETSLRVFSPDTFPLRVYIYLSPDGEPPQDEHFIPLSYQAVIEVIQELLDKQVLTSIEQFLLKQFQENITRGIAVDPKTLELAQDVYDHHKKVLEFIIQNVDRDVDEESNNSGDRSWDGKSRFFNTGENPGSGYQWADYYNYGFICAGGGKRYRNNIEQIKVGEIIYAYVSGRGYVGIGEVTRKAVPFRNARTDDDQPLSGVVSGTYDDSEDDENCDWVAFVNWKHKVPKEQAVRLQPISRLTTSRIYDDRKDITDQVRTDLANRNGK